MEQRQLSPLDSKTHNRARAMFTHPAPILAQRRQIKSFRKSKCHSR